MKKQFFLIFLIALANSTFAENYSNNDRKATNKLISGKVIDKKSGEELVGAEVKIAGKSIYTDFNGNFSTSISSNETEVLINFISYEQSKVNIDTHSYNTLVVELVSK